MKIALPPAVETGLDTTGTVIDCTERLLRVLQGVVTLVSATGPSQTVLFGRAVDLNKVLNSTLFCRDLCFSVGIVRDVWALNDDEEEDPSVLRSMANLNAWVLDGTTTLMFFEDWTPLKLGAFAPLVEAICSISWVSFFAIDAIANIDEQDERAEPLFASPWFYKSIADLGFATTTLWAPGIPQGAAAIASGAIGFGCFFA